MEKGRPEVSYKYTIPGVGPVAITEFRKYIAARSKAMKITAKAKAIESRAKVELEQGITLVANKSIPIRISLEIFEELKGICIEKKMSYKEAIIGLIKYYRKRNPAKIIPIKTEEIKKEEIKNG